MDPNENLVDIFKEAMLAKQKQSSIIPDNNKNYQVFKDQILINMKGLFESIDDGNTDTITNKCIDLANITFLIAKNLGKLETSGTKIINFGGNE